MNVKCFVNNNSKKISDLLGKNFLEDINPSLIEWSLISDEDILNIVFQVMLLLHNAQLELSFSHNNLVQDNIFLELKPDTAVFSFYGKVVAFDINYRVNIGGLSKSRAYSNNNFIIGDESLPYFTGSTKDIESLLRSIKPSIINRTSLMNVFSELGNKKELRDMIILLSKRFNLRKHYLPLDQVKIFDNLQGDNRVNSFIDYINNLVIKKKDLHSSLTQKAVLEFIKSNIRQQGDSSMYSSLVSYVPVIDSRLSELTNIIQNTRVDPENFKICPGLIINFKNEIENLQVLHENYLSLSRDISKIRYFMDNHKPSLSKYDDDRIYEYNMSADVCRRFLRMYEDLMLFVFFEIKKEGKIKKEKYDLFKQVSRHTNLVLEKEDNSIIMSEIKRTKNLGRNGIYPVHYDGVNIGSVSEIGFDSIVDSVLLLYHRLYLEEVFLNLADIAENVKNISVVLHGYLEEDKMLLNTEVIVPNDYRNNNSLRSEYIKKQEKSKVKFYFKFNNRYFIFSK
jgi:hypothetical protein